MFHFFVLQVLIPNGAYQGQQLIKLVNKKIIDNAINTYAKVPSITLKKYSSAITIATKILMPLSVVPMFFFISKILNYY